MIFDEYKIGDLFPTKNGKIVEYVASYPGTYPTYDCVVDDEIRIYRSDGKLSSALTKAQELSIVKHITKEKNPEYFL